MDDPQSLMHVHSAGVTWRAGDRAQYGREPRSHWQRISVLLFSLPILLLNHFQLLKPQKGLGLWLEKA